MPGEFEHLMKYASQKLSGACELLESVDMLRGVSIKGISQTVGGVSAATVNKTAEFIQNQVHHGR